MKNLNLVCMMGIIILASWSGAISAQTDIKAATTNCRDEADIQAYINLCMQAWQNPADYTNSNSAPEDINEQPAGAP